MTMRIGYHLAPSQFRASIAAHGLNASRSGRRHDPRSHAPVAVYFHMSRAAVDDMMSLGLGRTHDLYRVRIPSDVLLYVDPYEESARFAIVRIGPEHVTLIRPASRTSRDRARR